MDEAELNKLAETWIRAQHTKLSDQDDEIRWMDDVLTEWMYVDEESSDLLWRFIQNVYPRDMSDKTISLLAAGPLEHFLAHHGPAYIDQVETLARKDPKFNYLLGGVWRNSMTDDVWERVQKARLSVW